MHLSREQLTMCQTALQAQADSLRCKIADLVNRGFSESRGTKEHREELFRVAVLRDAIQKHLLEDANFPNPRDT